MMLFSSYYRSNVCKRLWTFAKNMGKNMQQMHLKLLQKE